MKNIKIILAMLLALVGLKKLSQSIDPNLDMVREASGFKNILPPAKKSKK